MTYVQEILILVSQIKTFLIYSIEMNISIWQQLIIFEPLLCPRCYAKSFYMH